MGYLTAVDTSQWQGAYKDYGTPIHLMKAGGGDNGLYLDTRLFECYAGAKAQGKAIGMYWFAGAGNPEAEANYFLKCVAPLEENDVLILDWEVQHPNPVDWCRRFADTVHNATGVWVILYINLATLRAYDWLPVLKDCGLWIAAWTGDPNVDVNTNGHPYIIHQYQGSPLDRDAVWLSLDQFKRYGYHSPVPVPVTPPPAPPETPPATVPEPETSPAPPVPEATAAPLPPLTPQDSSVAVAPKASLFSRFLNWLIKLLTGRKA